MSDLTFNKIAGGVLLTGLVIFGLREASDIVFKKHEVEKAGYEIAVQEESAGGGEVADTPPDWAAVLTPANVAAGAAVSAKCAACHKLDASNANATGPGLWDVLGRKPAAHPGYNYSGAMKDFAGKQPVWDYDALYTFLKAPGKDVPGTNMTFVGLKKPEDRIAMIAYLHSLGSKLPVPPPRPAAAAAAPAAGAPADAAAPAAPGGATAPAPGAATAPAAPAAGGNTAPPKA
ncbi:MULTISPECIES: cytochrome c family protein [unclassified Caulobacter]|uniref:c-type cytochrome n=1 Tax=unclassified Caulobacter TaxID=2648921 RepID=UPI000701EB9D|nr:MULTISPECIES: cytochrome c family protein [unclassified Caulobacter]KQV56003.1 cytochrome C [Caulobacter sp. Root342]KQV70823.1 cytochrome C [Caulobacter sp. Root343]